MSVEWQWYYSWNEEEYWGGYDTREEAIDELEGEPGFIVEAKKPDIRLADFLTSNDIDCLTENMVERIDEAWGNPEGSEIDLGKEVQYLEPYIRAAIATWQVDHKVKIDAWVFADMRNHEEVQGND